MKQSRVFIVAGEASGDILGSRLMTALTKLSPDVHYSGVGGDTMTKLGFVSIFPMHELSVMGIMEVLPRYLKLRKRFHDVIEAAIAFAPDVVVTIDFPGFNIRLVRELRRYLPKTRFLQYVGPSVWAHKPKRAKTVAELFDHVLLLLPFEKPYFEDVGAISTVVGHPILEHECRKVSEKFAKKYLTDASATPILVMPGSREAEIRKLLPIFVEAISMLDGKNIYLIPTLPHLADIINQYGRGLNFNIITDEEERWQAMAACKVALVKSGTGTVELMAYRLPMVIAYSANWLSKLYVWLYVKVKYASLVNLVLNRPAIPELLFDRCTAEHIHKAISDLLLNPQQQSAQKQAMDEAIHLMRQGVEGVDGEAPSMAAARVVKQLIEFKPNAILRG